MARKSSGLLNQQIEEPIEETKMEIVSQVYEEQIVENTNNLEPIEEEIQVITNESNEPVINNIINKSIELPVFEVSNKKTLSDLSRSEFRTYQRTGILPSF